MNDKILSYATNVLAYDGGSFYGQCGSTPKHEGLTYRQADMIRAVARCGKRAGIAQKQNDTTRASFERENLTKTRSIWKQAGLPINTIDAVFHMGYKAG